MDLPDFLIERPYGEIMLAGHRIGLYTIIRVYKEGQTPEEIHETYPTIPVDLALKVIAFYQENMAEVDSYVAACAAEIDRQAADCQGPGLAELRRRAEALRQVEAP